MQNGQNSKKHFFSHVTAFKGFEIYIFLIISSLRNNDEVSGNIDSPILVLKIEDETLFVTC